MRETLVVVLWVVFSGLAHGANRTHVFVDILKSWVEARDYCRGIYDDLSTITNVQENDILESLMKKHGVSYSWIGLNKYVSVSSPRVLADLFWNWANGDPFVYKNWAPGEPNFDEKCAELQENGLWNNRACDNKRTFFCFESKWISGEIVLVTEKMTWEEALLYCREKYTDLASLLTDKEAARADATAGAAHTAQVWTSLRFLADAWLWVSETNQTKQKFTQGSLPSCPVQHHSCGARSPNDGRWENRNCQEKLNFLCYRAY
ncbi:macrophage mannose receptor 1-like [Alosa sapidissima]|uniref:macrophage mannose receptor 1-like n=1 Tax=Alosa sapidissima TaxID=34773 RepID=UPI001C08A57F|nr:macrophage mannose receptor 1-like [Alosa sapidissima]